MKTGHYAVVSTAGFILSVVVLASAVIGLSFLSESLRRAPLPPLGHALRWAAILVALSPLLTAFISARLCAGPNGENLRAGLWPWAPFIAMLLGAPLFAVLLHGVEGAVAQAQRRAHRTAVLALRAAVKGGDLNRSCELVSLDALSTPDEMASCRHLVDSLKDPSARLKALEGFVNDRHFKTWGYWEFGRPKGPGQDFTSAVPAEHQTWFLDAYFTTWMSRSDFLDAEMERDRFLNLTDDAGSDLAWSPEAREFFASRLAPRLIAAVKSLKKDFPGSPYSNAALLNQLSRSR